MTESISHATHREKLWSSEDDEPNVCTSDGPKTEPRRPDGSTRADQPALACVWEGREADAGPEPNFGAFGRAAYDPEQAAGARGAGHGPASEPSDEVRPRDNRRGAGISIGIQGGGAVGGGPGLAGSMEVGVILHSRGLSLYTTDTKLPTHCEDARGNPDTCSKGIGAAAGVGLSVQVLPDVDAAEGEGRVIALDTPGVSLSAGYIPDEKFTSFGICVGPSVGAVGHVDHTVTRIHDITP